MEESTRYKYSHGIMYSEFNGCTSLTSRAAHVAPSRDQTRGSRVSAARGQGHGADVAVQGGGIAQLDQHDVIVQVTAVVVGMTDDLSRVDELLGALVHFNVVLTKTNLDTAGGNEAFVQRWLFQQILNKCL